MANNKKNQLRLKTLSEELESKQKEQQKKSRAKKTLSEEEREIDRAFARLLDSDTWHYSYKWSLSLLRSFLVHYVGRDHSLVLKEEEAEREYSHE